ncbi:MAG TPA: ATP-binding protein [Cyanobacteria bacterium UBA8803]|nr:ATP-binding protein [Cyanobacteria bacterium UBA9273]HBL57804.1 ATP-binding protein [Cyanobacteria bacterium UBA8803]
MTQVFGDFIEAMPISEEYLTLGFSPSSLPIKQRWRNNGLSADFLADYLTTFFPGDHNDPNTVQRQTEIKGAVSYIANELLENAMKFSAETSHYTIRLQLQLESDKIVFFVTNTVTVEGAEKFQSFIKELLDSDPYELYINHLEKQAEEENTTKSGLGFLTMINDYDAQLGWKFEAIQQEPEMIAVTSMVQLKV